MFATTFPDRTFSPDAPERENDALRVFDWPELVARIAATNDLRRVVSDSRKAGGFASFHTESAGALTECANGKRAVNPDGLGAGKQLESNGVGTNCCTRDGDRED